jgi:hypothetical protein
VTLHAAVKRRPRNIKRLVRFSLIAGAAAWWALVIRICWTMPQPDGRGVRTLVFNCPSGVAFITPIEKAALYGLVGVCVVLMLADLYGRARDHR